MRDENIIGLCWEQIIETVVGFYNAVNVVYIRAKLR